MERKKDEMSPLMGEALGYALGRGFHAGFFAAGEVLARAAKARRHRLPFEIEDELKRTFEDVARQFMARAREVDLWK